MYNSTTHDFHFVMVNKTKERLMRLTIFKKSTGLSGILVKILQLLTPVIRNEHKWGEQRLSKYKLVCNDPDEIRRHVHMYVPGELYRELKLLHQDLNFYSIAQLVRGLFDFFLGLVDVYGDDVLYELGKQCAHWRSGEMDTRQTSRKVMRQLFKIIRHLPGKDRLVTVYDAHFSPFWILRM